MLRISAMHMAMHTSICSLIRKLLSSVQKLPSCYNRCIKCYFLFFFGGGFSRRHNVMQDLLESDLVRFDTIIAYMHTIVSDSCNGGNFVITRVLNIW